MAADLPPVPTLTTPRLTLDALTPADADAFFQIHSVTEVSRYLSMEPMQQMQEAVAQLELLARLVATGEELVWAIRRNDDARLIGLCVLVDAHSPRRRAELGYTLARDVWRQGYAREAIGAVLAYGFGPLQLNRIEALVYAENAGSRALLRGLGFAEEGYLREHAWEKGRYWDDVILALLAREYASGNAQQHPYTDGHAFGHNAG